MTYKLRIKQDTYLKATPEQSATIRMRNIPNALLAIAAGTDLTCHDAYFWEGHNVQAAIDGDDHYAIQLTEPRPDSLGLRWFVWAQDAELDEGT
ncbi:MAG: hypothetical protein AAFQ99_04640, partial [Pseudomonadota bacterium]